METKMNLDDFLSSLQAYNEEISYAVHYSKKLIETVHVNPVLSLEINNETNHCKALRKKYESILNNNSFDGDYESRLVEAGKTFGDDALFLYDFIYKLDMILMLYGEGKEFHEFGVLQRQPMEV